ncbi:MAG TPA: L-histidine N(alpha)-methyltransferase [Ignavibacteriales bacterium]|nr:L-histidine N(alpha)-methyltransferase [Ignavibacteriales bacterium]
MTYTHFIDTTQKDIKEEILEGLASSPKKIPTKLFYDERGSMLFDKICDLPEYYPTRTELRIMKDNIEEITGILDADTMLIELGSGSSLKTRLILDRVPQGFLYVPVDISLEHLLKTAEALSIDYPDISIHPICADFTGEFVLPEDLAQSDRRKVIYYPGSTIGNFTPDEVKEFLYGMRELCGKDGALIIGVDLKKDTQVLYAAYNDAQGVTAEFNLNLLERLNREYGADFDAGSFRHEAIYNEEAGRIEMYLISGGKQTVNILDNTFVIEENEKILTEYSYKYTIEEFAKLIEGVFKTEKVWTDGRCYFGVLYMR